jgi:hypothetical protein
MNTQIDLIIKNSHSKSDVARALNIPINGTGLRKINNLIKDYDTSHFNRYWKQQNEFLIYERIEKTCPVCGTLFKTQKGNRKEKTTCSHSCSNTFHRSGDNNPNYKNYYGKSPNASYRRICFTHHEKKCIICDENKIVQVHHYDGDHKNNKPENLVPLCPTHHSYWHSRYRPLIQKNVDDYVIKFISNMG